MSDDVAIIVRVRRTDTIGGIAIELSDGMVIGTREECFRDLRWWERQGYEIRRPIFSAMQRPISLAAWFGLGGGRAERAAEESRHDQWQEYCTKLLAKAPGPATPSGTGEGSPPPRRRWLPW